jgi:hypothetical protein
MRKAILLAGSSMLIAIYGTGCSGSGNPVTEDKQQRQPMNEFFPPQNEIRDVERVLRAQTASGARSDGTLEPFHFDKGELNSTGKQKLALMLDDDDSNNPLIVYMNTPGDDLKAARQDAVVAYLKEQGLEEKQVTFKPAPNMNSGGAATIGLTRMNKLETPGTGGGSSSGSGSSEGSSSSSSSGSGSYSDSGAMK